MTSVAPRLHVITALACDKALVLRRGPSGMVASLLWNRACGSFEMGQWLKGRVYEHRCDLSPDARHMVIFARRDNASLAWTALSRAPWLRAIEVFPQQHTWCGGGAFDRDGRLWLNGATLSRESVADGVRLADSSAFPHATDGFHMGDLYARMMMLRGWSHDSGSRYETILTKPLWSGWTLELGFQLGRKNRGGISNRYALVNAGAGVRLEQPEWEWAEPFGDVLQFAQYGALQAATLDTRGAFVEQTVVSDLSAMTFEAIKAPYEGIDFEGAGL